MEQLTSEQTGRSYRIGQALPILGDGFFRGYMAGEEVTLRVGPRTGAAGEMLQAEAVLLKRLNSPQIIGLCDQGETTEQAFLVFDSPAGQPLSDLIHEAELSITAGLDAINQVVVSVAVLHAAGIAWGWLRPQAFWIDKTGRITLANLRGAAEPVAQSGLTLAEATYLAPEHSDGQPPTTAGDVYACGVLAYEILAGRPPFAAAGPADLVVKHLAEPPTPLKQLCPELPDDLTTLIDRCLAKESSIRPQNAQELLSLLRPIYERLQAEEQARMVSCPRCQGLVLPAVRCPLCNAPLSDAPKRPAQRIRLRPLLVAGVACMILIWSLRGLFSQTQAPAEAAAPPSVSAQPTRQATPVPAASPSPLPTATAVPPREGLLVVTGGDVPDPNIDLIRARMISEGDDVEIELEVAGRVDGQAGERVYQTFVDTGDGGDTSTPWPELGADRAIIYRTGDETATVLSWNGSAWDGIGIAQVTRQDASLIVRVPLALVNSALRPRYAILATNPGANLADYAPPRGTQPAEILFERGD